MTKEVTKAIQVIEATIQNCQKNQLKFGEGFVRIDLNLLGLL